MFMPIFLFLQFRVYSIISSSSLNCTNNLQLTFTELLAVKRAMLTDILLMGFMLNV